MQIQHTHRPKFHVERCEWVRSRALQSQPNTSYGTHILAVITILGTAVCKAKTTDGGAQYQLFERYENDDAIFATR